ncbi:MAG: hypothetical protein FWD15_05890 [Alphaproteobacteria bacterium]|nr:hypothetical protein [Alphaproteobacteria bacterium]
MKFFQVADAILNGYVEKNDRGGAGAGIWGVNEHYDFKSVRTGETLATVHKVVEDDYCSDLCGFVSNPKHPDYKKGNDKECLDCRNKITRYYISHKTGCYTNRLLGRAVLAFAKAYQRSAA